MSSRQESSDRGRAAPASKKIISPEERLSTKLRNDAEARFASCKVNPATKTMQVKSREIMEAEKLAGYGTSAKPISKQQKDDEESKALQAEKLAGYTYAKNREEADNIPTYAAGKPSFGDTAPQARRSKAEQKKSVSAQSARVSLPPGPVFSGSNSNESPDARSSLTYTGSDISSHDNDAKIKTKARAVVAASMPVVPTSFQQEGTPRNGNGNLSMPGVAISVPGLDGGSGHMPADLQDRRDSVRSRDYINATGSTTAGTVVAHLVSDDDGPESSQVIHAIAKKDSFWELLRHDRRTKIVTGVILAAIIGLGVGLGFAMSSSPTEPAEEKYVPVGSDIDGPGRAFEYGPGDGSKFGSSISTSRDGSRIAIGAPEYSSVDGERFRGIVQVFEEQGDDWVLLEPSILGDGGNEMAGSSVALSLDGTTLAVGSPEHNEMEQAGAAKAGQVKAYKRIGEAWEQMGQPILGKAAFDFLGSSVGISEDGSRLAMSVPGNEHGADSIAKVYEFDDAVDDWVQLGEDLNGRSGGSPLSMSADGNTVAMGSLSTAENNYVGAVRLYEYASGGWRLMGSDIVLKAPKPGSYDVLWTPSLSSDGKTVAIGSSVQNPKLDGEEYGLFVRAFRFNEDVGDWLPLGQTQHDKTGSHLISYVASLSADSSVMVIGDPGGFAMGTESGHAHVLRLVDDDWVHIDKELEGTAAADHFGEAVTVSADGRRVGVGSPQSRAMGADLGRVTVYELNELTA